MKLKLIKLTEEYRDLLFDMMDEWQSTGEKIIPYSIRKSDWHDLESYINSLEVTPGEAENSHLVPDSTYFCLDEDEGRLVGAVNIRHYLNDKLLLDGGHIGDGVRPSARRRGVGTAMVALALEKCRELGIEKVLMVCDKDNAASAKTIIKNGGVLENEVTVDGKIIQRYWIDNKSR